MSLSERVRTLEDFKASMDVGWGVLAIVDPTESKNVVKCLTNPDVWTSSVFRLGETKDGYALESDFFCKMEFCTTGEEPGEWYHIVKNEEIDASVIFFAPTTKTDSAIVADELQRVLRRMSVRGVRFVMMASDN